MTAKEDYEQQTVSVTITNPPGNSPPVIGSLTATPNATDSSTPVVYNWNVSDIDGDTLTCLLDVDGDGTDDFTINDCANNSSQAHTFAISGNYTSRLTVNDGKGGSEQQTVSVTINKPPVIYDFSISPDPAFINSAASFSWDVSDANGDTLTCKLDIENDGTDDFTINDCANNISQAHTYTVAGNYTAKLTVDDGIASPVVQTLNFIVIAPPPPLSTDVSVNGPAVAGERVLYTITVGNTTTLPIDDVLVSLAVPAELSFYHSTDAEPNAASCSYCNPGYEATWDLGTLSAGESRTITVNALVDDAILSGVTITLPVTFSATGVSDILINRNVVVLNAPLADLSLSASTDPVVPNETFTYQIDFGNTSGGTLTTTELRAFLPAGVTVSSISDGGTEVNTGEVVWNEGSLGVGISLHREITVTADSGLTAGQILKTTAQLTHDGGLVVDNTAEHVLTVVSAVFPLEVDISTSANPVIQDEHVIYTLTVSNSSLVQVDNVYVIFRVPAELSFKGYNDAEPNAASCSYCDPGNEATWNLGSLAAGESRTITVNALVDSVLSGNLISVPVRVTATALNDTIDLLKTVAVFNGPLVDLALSASTDPVLPNETFTYQLDFGNTSAGTLTNVELRAFLPSGVTVSSISNGGIDTGAGEVVWNEGSLGVGNSLHREITVTADSGLTAGRILKTTAQLTHDGGLVVDNTAEHVLTVVSAVFPLEVDISTSANPVIQDEHVIYTLTVSNSSLVQVDNVYVIFRVPAELSFKGYNDAEPNAASCSYCDPGNEATWNLGSLAAGESRTITVNALVDSVLSGNLISVPVRVTATALNDTIDLLKTVAVFNDPLVDLALSASTDPVMPNETFTYNLDFGNTSAGTLTNVELRAFLPSGVTVSSISNGGIDAGAGEVVWNEGSLGVGNSLHREITVTADSGLTAGRILKTTAQLTHDGGLVVDNTAEHVLTVVSAVFPLEVDISTSANPVIQDEHVIYTLTVSNSSLVQVDNVYVIFRVPAELSFKGYNDAEPNAASCSYCDPGNEATWNLGSLAAGESRTITVNALVDSVLSGNLISVPVRVTATALNDTIDLLKTVAVFNDPLVDLALSASTDPVMPNETFTYNLDFGNTSAGTLTTTELRAFLPAGVTVSSISDGGTEVNTGEVVWGAVNLGSGVSLHREITVLADGATAGDNLKLYAELTYDGGLEIDNRSEFAVSVAGSGASAALLSVDIVATPDPVASSAILAYTITVTNNFGLPLNNVSLTFRVPAELFFNGVTGAEPNASCSSYCDPGDEANWNLGTMAAGSNQVISINATVGTAIDDGNLIVVPVRVTATELLDTINLQHTTVIVN